MKIELQVLLAFVLDLIIGDPRSIPHPVTLLSRLASKVEFFCRKKFGDSKRSGILAAVFIYLTAFLSVFLIRKLLGLISPLLESLFSIFVIYICLATKCLYQHIWEIYEELKRGDLDTARKKVALIVGRDTHSLREEEVVRGAVESAAESLVDGITAPLFFALLGGAEWAFFYKAVNTLDSIWGHKDNAYLHFGYFAAKVDDICNYLPARLTAPLIAVASFIMGHDFKHSLRILLRDGKKHPSPNSGLPEAAMAGALKIQLGGDNYYQGELLSRPLIGDNINPLGLYYVKISCKIVLVTTVIFLIIGLVLAHVIH
ncbi:MAG: cobalamin biosynthesis protein CobD [Oligoflexia bacterium]|nr:cobalamin biosynthesis protein CobD [Oligoflexia bacterium]